ncbi:hypothetical protein JYJ95_12905 [Corallococcus exiguus]|uniref:hypothetical protein n=1 Tax=Corallococcus TaxID=83461 RepID=UPI000EA39B20|nr:MULTISPECIES: hypothetical protein [Corallococcus]MBN8467415.1 hypothetical protein [Corallococcus exiguus]RKG55411.1 hypothetical protein D7X30_26615 [Corallococcus sp. AB011P]
MTEAKRVDPYAHLMDLGRGALHQAIAAQRSALEYSRQFVEGDAAARPLRSQHEEWVRKALETLAPFYALEQLARDQLLKAQASLFELADDTLRNLTLHGVERGGHRSA